MWNTSRGLRETVIRAMAKVGLVWAVVVLGALFMAMSSQGQKHDGGYTLSAPGADHGASFSVPGDEAPRTAGLALALVVLGGGITVLAVGAARGEREPQRAYADLEPTADLSLALGLGLLA
jgi:hypothetical protein